MEDTAKKIYDGETLGLYRSTTFERVLDGIEGVKVVNKSKSGKMKWRNSPRQCHYQYLLDNVEIDYRSKGREVCVKLAAKPEAEPGALSKVEQMILDEAEKIKPSKDTGSN